MTGLPKPLMRLGVDDGENVFAILGRFRRAARDMGWSGKAIDAVLDDATSGDYDHLLATIAANVEDDPLDGAPDPSIEQYYPEVDAWILK